MEKIKYQKLARARSRQVISIALVSRTSLWLGPDHLLFIDSNGYQENYKRFYFKDIQSIILQKTETAKNVNIVLGVLAGLFAFFGVISSLIGLKIFLLFIAAVLGLFLLFNAIPGASCRCYLKTAVQSEELSALARLRRARKVLDRIRPLIAAAQGGPLVPENIPALLGRMAVDLAAPTPATPTTTMQPAVPPRLEAQG